MGSVIYVKASGICAIDRASAEAENDGEKGYDEKNPGGKDVTPFHLEKSETT
jgi:hypothetical protein